MSVNAVLTIAINDSNEYQKVSELTHLSLKEYAKKIRADFICIDKRKISETTPHWEKFQIYDLLDTYDRILYLDTDIIVREDCPNLFEVVSEDKLGMFEEGQFTDRSKELMIDICRSYDVKLPKWNGKYYNSGVLVISQKHKFLFKKPRKEVFSFFEQSYLNMMIAQNSVEMCDLHYKFNRMPCMDRFTGEDRRNSYIIHYAGALYHISFKYLMELIELDLCEWKKGKDYSKKHLYISVLGGLGDQLCAEPAIRFMKEKLYPNDEMVVATHFPRVFRHLEKLGVEICEQGKANLKDDTAYFIVSTLPGPEELQWSIISHLLCHSVDYTSIALMKRTLPLMNKQLKFELSLRDYSKLFDLVGSDNLKDYIVVHPGRHWETKTFPVKYWQAIIDGLVKRGSKVIIIGKYERGDPPDYIEGARGTVDVKCPEEVIDLRDKLDLGELAALLSIAKILISNDSSPVHLAGAFDNWIVLLPSCKHPHHILPFRNGSQFYKTRVFYKKLIIDEVESRPTQVYSTSVDIKINDWSKYLEDPEIIVQKILLGE